LATNTVSDFEELHGKKTKLNPTPLSNPQLGEQKKRPFDNFGEATVIS